ncbi:MAG: carboxypeptidase regulatory-like domain-containing protein [Bacteroidota bacterium]
MAQPVRIYIIILLLTCSCITSKISRTNEGIQGKVLWVEGNRMPAPNKTVDEGKPVIREIHIYKVLKLNDLDRTGSLFLAPQQKPVLVTKTNEFGEFKVNLESGIYSILTKEKDGFFANSFDSENHVHPVKITAGNFTNVKIIINYKAVY